MCKNNQHRTLVVSRVTQDVAVVLICLLVSPVVVSASTLAEVSCVVSQLDQVTISAEREGVIERLMVREGDDIESGDLLLQINSEEAKALLKVALAREEKARLTAENEWDVKVAVEQLSAAAKEDELLKSVPNAPYLEKFRAEAKRKQLAASVESARQALLANARELDVANAEIKVARLNIEDRSTVSPITGAVARQHKYQGDWTDRGSPILTVVRMDRLVLKGVVNIRQLAPHDAVGRTASVTLNANSQSAFEFHDLVINKVAPTIDIDGNYVVWAMVENQREANRQGALQWLLRPGMTGTLTISAEGSPSNGKLARKP